MSEWKFALSPDQREYAIWMPGNEPWFAQVISNSPGRWIGSAEMEESDWTVYAQPDPQRHEPNPPTLCRMEIADPDDEDEIHICKEAPHDRGPHECSCGFFWGRPNREVTG